MRACVRVRILYNPLHRLGFSLFRELDRVFSFPFFFFVYYFSSSYIRPYSMTLTGLEERIGVDEYNGCMANEESHTRSRFTHILRAIVALILCRYAFIFLFFVFPVICRGERIHIKYVINPLPDVCVRIDGFVFSQDDWFLIEPREENIAQSQARLLPHEVSLHILHIYFLLSTNAFLTNIKTDSTRRLRSVRYFFLIFFF